MNNNRLYIKISLTLLGILAVLGMGYILITGYVGNQYLQESNQKLYGGIADSTVNQVQPLIDGNVDTTALQDIMHSLMVINPSAEVYLLDTSGNIKFHVAPYKRVKLTKVDLTPIHTFVNSTKRPFIKGDDPRHPGEFKVFSAARILEEGKLTGYLYIILASEEEAAVTATLFDSYILKLGVNLFFITLLGALILGLIAIWYLTRNLRKIIEKVNRFKEGDYDARIQTTGKSELTVLGNTFNEMADTIVANIEELKSVENLRRELIANVSHDLRTPLAIMQGYVETLLIKEEKLSATERQHYLNIVLQSSERLTKLVSQLFEYSKLEAKQIEPQKESFFIQELAYDIFYKYQILGKSKGIEIALDTPQTLPLVFADVGLVERVFQNLLDNALKFTPKGGKVTMTLKSENNHVAISVTDTGQGISKEQQSIIFERYQKANTTENKGAGLGLAIVSKILELHDATIRVQSQLNEGTTFMFQLPAIQQDFA